jgi:hypothetical protein
MAEAEDVLNNILAWLAFSSEVVFECSDSKITEKDLQNG